MCVVVFVLGVAVLYHGKGWCCLRVLIELLDRESIENVLSACVFSPDIVVYLCDERDSEFFKESAICRLFQRRKMKTRARFYYFNSTDPEDIQKALSAVVRDYPGCVFDFTGGRELVLLMAGTSFAKLDVPGFFIDISKKKFVNLRGCEKYEQDFKLPSFTVEDVFTMNGAKLHGSGHFTGDVIEEKFEEDIISVFEIVMKNPSAWSKFVSWLQAACSDLPHSQTTVSAPKRMKWGRNSAQLNVILLERLQECGVIENYKQVQNKVEFTFASKLHRKCLLIEGVWLELYCYVMSKRSGFFCDVRTSVVVDWDGEESGPNNTKNEVDVLLINHITPVFISCKMSMPSPLALSEIKLLSGKFGGRRSRAVVVTMDSLKESHKALQSRAKDMHITIIDKSVLESGRLSEKLKALCS